MIRDKIKRNFAKVLTLGVALVFINSYNAKAYETTTSTPENSQPQITLTGYVIDEHCFARKQADPGKDSKRCFLMNGCIKGGYGIAVPQIDGSYQFYYFDGNFFTDTVSLDGTGGQRLAYDIGANTTRVDHLSVTVTGSFTGESKPGVSATTVNYKVFKVNSIKETDTNDVTGYLVDENYFASNSSNPSGETKEELLSETAAKSGYGVAVPQSDGSYKFYYLHGNVYSSIAAADATGAQATAYSTISSSTNLSKLAVNINGAIVGAIKTSLIDGKIYPIVDVHGLKEISSSDVENIVAKYKVTLDSSENTNTATSSPVTNKNAELIGVKTGDNNNITFAAAFLTTAGFGLAYVGRSRKTNI